MARQIIDLPVIDNEELAPNDLLVVRDFSEKKDKRIRLDELASSPLIASALATVMQPVGSMLTFDSESLDPNDMGLGEWQLVRRYRKRDLVNSYVLDWAADGQTNNTSRNRVLGSYNYQMIERMIEGISAPDGFHFEWRLTAEVSTSNATGVRIFLNNQYGQYRSTYSGSSFRDVSSTDYFRKEDVVLEATVNYGSAQGINVGWQANAASGTSRVSRLTLHAFLVSDTETFEWKKVA